MLAGLRRHMWDSCEVKVILNSEMKYELIHLYTYLRILF